MMKKIICLIFAITVSLCAFSQQVYTKVYYDYVISGQVKDVSFVFDGYYSYHIVGFIPRNAYWELYPVGDVFICRRDGSYLGKFKPTHRWIFYNRTRHHEYRPPARPKPHRRPTPPPKPQPNRHKR